MFLFLPVPFVSATPIVSTPPGLSFYLSFSSSPPPLALTPTFPAPDTKLWSDTRPLPSSPVILSQYSPSLSRPPSASPLSFIGIRPPGEGYHIIKKALCYLTLGR